jgi:hypothetical protein
MFNGIGMVPWQKGWGGMKTIKEITKPGDPATWYVCPICKKEHRLDKTPAILCCFGKWTRLDSNTWLPGRKEENEK